MIHTLWVFFLSLWFFWGFFLQLSCLSSPFLYSPWETTRTLSSSSFLPLLHSLVSRRRSEHPSWTLLCMFGGCTVTIQLVPHGCLGWPSCTSWHVMEWAVVAAGVHWSPGTYLLFRSFCWRGGHSFWWAQFIVWRGQIDHWFLTTSQPWQFFFFFFFFFSECMLEISTSYKFLNRMTWSATCDIYSVYIWTSLYIPSFSHVFAPFFYQVGLDVHVILSLLLWLNLSWPKCAKCCFFLSFILFYFL